VTGDIDIKGGADEFEATVIAVVIDRINQEEQAARQGRGRAHPGLPAWVRALQPEDNPLPRDLLRPE
jgi:hypothetical protein